MSILPKTPHILIVIIGVLLFIWASPTNAQPCVIGNSIQSTTGLCNPTAGQTLKDILNVLVDFLFTYGLPFVIIFMVIAGFMFVTAGGNEERITKARAVLFWTIIGAAVIVGAKIIAVAIQNFANQL